MQYYYNDKPIVYQGKDEDCPLCGTILLLKRVKADEGCIKIRYFKCAKCEFDTRNLELKNKENK